MDNVSGVLIRFKDQFLAFTNVPGIKIGVIDIIEILIISVLFYHILFWMGCMLALLNKSRSYMRHLRFPSMVLTGAPMRETVAR